MINTIYSGIDVSKDKLDVALTADGKTILSTATFLNSILGFQKLSIWISKHSKNASVVHFCIEATGIYHEEITEFLQEKENFIVSVINPFQAKAFAGSRLQRTKNDKVDANLLACYCAISKPRESVKTLEEVKTLRKLVRTLNYQIEERSKYKTKLHSVKDDYAAHVVIATISFFTDSIADIERKIKCHVEEYPELNHQVNLLKSIKGIGDRTAWQIIAEINAAEGETINSKAQVAHAGLAPREYQSGSSVNGKPRICKTGNKRLRKSLYMPAMSAMVYNPIMKEFYERLLSKGKPKKVALVAVMRKLLVLSIGILNNNKPFDENWLTNNQANNFHKNYSLAS
ncbi:MAG: transposase [bacterium]